MPVISPPIYGVYGLASACCSERGMPEPRAVGGSIMARCRWLMGSSTQIYLSTALLPPIYGQWCQRRYRPAPLCTCCGGQKMPELEVGGGSYKKVSADLEVNLLLSSWVVVTSIHFELCLSWLHLRRHCQHQLGGCTARYADYSMIFYSELPHCVGKTQL